MIVMCCSGLLGWMHFAMEWKERMDEAVDGTNRSGHCRLGGNGRNSEKNELINGIGSCDYMFVEICMSASDGLLSRSQSTSVAAL